MAIDAFNAIVPHYHPGKDQATAVGTDGRRWFEEQELAIADALYRIAHRPYDPSLRMDQFDWILEENDDGLWAVPPGTIS